MAQNDQCLQTTLAILEAESQIYHVPLDETGQVTLDWILDYSRETLAFEVHLPSSFSWFVIGFSDYGKPFPADYCTLWYDWKNKLHFQDSHATENGVLHIDSKQDCKEFRIAQRGNVTKFTFSREFDTCDNDDYVIEVRKLHFESLRHLVNALGWYYAHCVVQR